MPDFSAYTEKYWSAPAVPVPPAAPIGLTVRVVQLEEIGEDRDTRPVAYFEEDPRGLVLDGRRYSSLTDGAGTADTDKWAGRRVELYRGVGKFRGKPYERIEVRCL